MRNVSINVGELAVTAEVAKRPSATPARLEAVTRAAFARACHQLRPFFETLPDLAYEIDHLAVAVDADGFEDNRLREALACALRDALRRALQPLGREPGARARQVGPAPGAQVPVAAAVLELARLAGVAAAELSGDPAALARELLRALRSRPIREACLTVLDERRAASIVSWLLDWFEAPGPASAPAAPSTAARFAPAAIELRVDGPWFGPTSARSRLGLLCLAAVRDSAELVALARAAESLLRFADVTASAPWVLAERASPVAALAQRLASQGVDRASIAAVVEWLPRVDRESTDAALGLVRGASDAEPSPRFRTALAGLSLLVECGRRIDLAGALEEARLEGPARASWLERMWCRCAGHRADPGDPLIAHLCGRGRGPRRAVPLSAVEEQRLAKAVAARLPAELGKGRNDHEDTASLIAAALLRSLAQRLHNFADSSDGYLQRQLVAVPGRGRLGERELDVVIEPIPLGVLVQMSGLSRGAVDLWWAEPRLMRFRLEV